MPREVPPPPEWHNPPAGETITLKLKLITPMFGGGYEPREVDTVMPIRPAAIRGHLRFWWRALYGGQYTDSEALFKAEKAIWGSMEEPGKVRVVVTDVNVGPPVEWARFDRHPGDPNRYRALATQLKPGWPRYALHPFQGQLANGRGRIEHHPDRAIESGTFVIRAILPKDLRDQVLATFGAWIRYGGVGVRSPSRQRIRAVWPSCSPQTAWGLRTARLLHPKCGWPCGSERPLVLSLPSSASPFRWSVSVHHNHTRRSTHLQSYTHK